MACLFSAQLLLAQETQPAFEDTQPNLGPLYDQFALTLSPGHRTEAAGPFYYAEQRETEKIWAVPPILSLSRDPATESMEFNLAYPVLSYVRFGQQYRWQLFQLLSFAGGPTQQETERHRFTLFPIYFQQRSSDPTQNYTAVGPFYGHLQNRLMRDEISYVMFPFYSRTRKRDVITDNYLYPLFHLRRGNELSGWQFWPLVGHEEKGVTTRTNRFGDVELIGGHERWFALWPIYYDVRSGLGTEDASWQGGVLPLYALQRSAQRDSTTVIWPFFSSIDDRQKKYREWHAPWPLVVFARGEGKTTTRVLPFYSHAQTTNLHRDSYLWPIYRYDHIYAPPLDRQRKRVLFFLFSDVTDKDTQSGASRRRVDFWPLFTHRRDLNGNTRLQVLAPVEPLFPKNENIEREYAPVWSLWRSERNARTGSVSQSLLWNLYRREKTPDSTKTSAFFGLYQSSAGSEGKRVRVFLIPFGKPPPAN